MTDIQQRALDLLNESRIAFGLAETDVFFRDQTPENEALCRALERQERAITSELRPAMQVEQIDRELFIKLTGYDSNSIDAILGGSAFTWEVEQIARHRIAERERVVEEIVAWLRECKADWVADAAEAKFAKNMP